ncbi:hypothetical protein MRS76_20185 [Rhizobiaceae bacterium n13]|uniref:Transmembrane protein n=1 Tax=Ferirhizobium litorale TaxID=2927786 RepID=A0AAE3QK21_9HYPH|nr:hypothetical protein [Fererhizobium litorale]MDI7864261.1 hypothetical protein [Fererhizobium litorale]MDI7924634.1 hypothetical protein [Fererhizobium litorale]
MVDEEFWKAVQQKERASSKSRRTGLLNIVLLFGTAAVALSLILTPMLSGDTGTRRLASAPEDVDMISTGSIRTQESGKRYTIRRSILQETPGSVCIVDGYGADRC